MKSKRVFVVGLALVLLAMVAGVAVARTPHELNGVFWTHFDFRSDRLGAGAPASRTRIWNNNLYSVRVNIMLGNSTTHRDIYIASGQTIHMGRHVSVANVRRAR